MNTGQKGETKYTTAEVMLATGVGRGTVTNRAKKLGFKRDGTGYTAEQVLEIIAMPLMVHRKSEEMAMELRGKLNDMFREKNIPMGVVANKKGEWKLEFVNREAG